MHARLPSLKALRVFEAAARLKSFKMAAEELHVTQSAVSRQIKLLEEQLQVRLFWRLNRRVEPTPAAETLLPYLSRAFVEIANVTASLSRTFNELAKNCNLVIATTPGIAESWLGSRLGDFIRSYPYVDPEITVVASPIDELKAGKVEIAIEWDSGEWSQFHQTVLMDITEFLVCSPALLQNGPPLLTPLHLREHRLLHLTTRRTWRTWLQTFNVEGVDWTLGPVIRNVTLCMALAIAGEGIALGDEILAGDHLIAGKLVKPLPQIRTLDRRLQLLVQPAAMRRAEVAAFRSWLKSQIADHLTATRAFREHSSYYAAATPGR